VFELFWKLTRSPPYATIVLLTQESSTDVREQYTVVTRKGQITVPREIRKALGLEVGDRVAVSLEEDGRLRAVLRPVTSVADSTFGALGRKERSITEKEIGEAFAEHAEERDRRSRQL
jgi:AbrB family looped-hinge helix DNA binding protein